MAKDNRGCVAVAIAPAIFAVFLALPAVAETVCHFGNPGTTVSILSHPEAWAEVDIHNRLAFRSRRGPCVLTHRGGEVVVTYDPGPGREPDIFTVEAPQGYMADPDWLLVEDETRATVLIWPQTEGPGM